MTWPSPPLLHVHVVASGIDERMSVPFDRTLALGRDAECDVALPSATVSRRHLSLFMRRGRLVIRDHSSNGTRVNGEALHLAVRELDGTAALEVGPYSIAVNVQIEEPARPPTLLLGPPQQQAWQAEAVVAAPQVVRLAKTEPERQESWEPAEAEAEFVDGAQPTCGEPACDPSDPDAPDDPDEPPDLLDELLRDASVSAIMITGAASIYVERAGRRERWSACFADDQALLAALDRQLRRLDQQCEALAPMFSLTLSEGARLHAILPPLARSGPCLSIRKPRHTRRTLAELVEQGAASAEMAGYLAHAVRRGLRIVITGESCAGKTSLLDALLCEVPERERIVTIEHEAELLPSQPQVVALAAQSEGQGDHDFSYSLLALLRQARRLDADRIIVGELRGDEAGELLLQGGMRRGSITTVEATSCEAALRRLEQLCARHGRRRVPRTVRRQLATSLDLLVEQTRFRDGSRRITRVAEVRWDEARERSALRELFSFEQTSDAGTTQVEGVHRTVAAAHTLVGAPHQEHEPCP